MFENDLVLGTELKRYIRKEMVDEDNLKTNLEFYIVKVLMELELIGSVEGTEHHDQMMVNWNPDEPEFGEWDISMFTTGVSGWKFNVFKDDVQNRMEYYLLAILELATQLSYHNHIDRHGDGYLSVRLKSDIEQVFINNARVLQSDLPGYVVDTLPGSTGLMTVGGITGSIETLVDVVTVIWDDVRVGIEHQNRKSKNV